MSDSARFALDLIVCATLGIVLWGACAGIGYQILPRSDAPTSRNEPASWRQPGASACVGLGALMLLGGIAVLVRIPWWVVVVPFVLFGLGFAVKEVDWDRVRSPRSRSVVIIACVGVVGFGLVALIEALVGFRFVLHPWDDMRAYLPLAKRLVDTNGLVEPWNARRLQNVGGFTFLQAMPVAVFGDKGIGIVETMVASIFLAGLFIANGFRSTWTRVVSVGFIFAVPLIWVSRINTTGVLMGTPLLVAALAVTVELRRALRAGDQRAAMRWALGGGLVAAALLSVRPNLGVLAAGFVAAGALEATGTAVLDRVRVVIAAGASSVIAIVPWSIASWQAVRTPLFPLFTGNQNLEAVRTPPVRSLAHLVDQAYGLLRAGPYIWIALGVLVVGLLARKLLPDASFVAIAAAMTAAAIVAIAFQEHNAGRSALVRYVSPMSQGLAVFFVIELIRGIDVRPLAVPARASDRIVPILAIAAATAIVVVGYSGIALSVEYPTLPGGAALVDKAIRNDLHPAPNQLAPNPVLTTPGLVRAYRQALAHVKPDRTIAAVDRPYLIDYRRYDIPSLDLPGFTAPDGKFPFFTGPGPKIARLRAAGYDTLLATIPSQEIALNPTLLRFVVATPLPPYSKYARNYLDWADDIEAITKNAPGAVQRFGPLLVIDLEAAQQELAASSG